MLAVRWSLSHPLSATSVMELLAARGTSTHSGGPFRAGGAPGGFAHFGML